MIRNKIVLETSTSFRSNILAAIFFRSLIVQFCISLIIVSYRTFYLCKNQKFQSRVKLLAINCTSKASEIFMAGNKRRTKNNKIASKVSFFKKSSFSNSKHIVELRNDSTLIHKDRSIETVQGAPFIFRYKERQWRFAAAFSKSVPLLPNVFLSTQIIDSVRWESTHHENARSETVSLSRRTAILTEEESLVFASLRSLVRTEEEKIRDFREALE